MNPGILIEKTPDLEHPVLIAGFDGWGNALNVSKGMVTYLIHKLNAEVFARLNPDHFYRYDENRPQVRIETGNMRRFSPAGGTFYFVNTPSGESDLVVLQADEPTLKWFLFIGELFTLCDDLGVESIITLGSMYDNVLHTDRIISAVASDPKRLSLLEQKGVDPISYRGPSAIHSIIQSEGPKRGIDCISLWCHCPFYLQNSTHYGLMASLGALLSEIGGFALDTTALETGWQEVDKQIEELIKTNPDLQVAIKDLKKAKVRGSWDSLKESAKQGDNVINLTDFFKSR